MKLGFSEQERTEITETDFSVPSVISSLTLRSMDPLFQKAGPEVMRTWKRTWTNSRGGPVRNIFINQYRRLKWLAEPLRVPSWPSKGNVRSQVNEREKIGHCSAQRGVGDQVTKLPPDPTRTAFRGTMVYKCETERE